MKILHLADLHLDARGDLADSLRVLEVSLEIAKAEEVDLIAVAGDFFERRSSPAERTALASWLQEAAGVAEVVGCRGNHDAPEDLAIFNHLATYYPVHIIEGATVQPGSALSIETHSGRVGVLALSWVDKAHVAAALPADTEARKLSETTTGLLRGLLDCLRAEATRVRSLGAIPLLVGHVMVGGSVVSTGQMLIGQGVELAPSDLLDIGCEYVALGHIHREQSWHDGRVAYAGSPSRCNFGEREAKGCRLVTIGDDGRFVESLFVELPARPIVLVEGGIDGGEIVFRGDWDQDVSNAAVRIRIHCPADVVHLVDEALLTRQYLDLGAHEVAVEVIVEHETRTRAPEISTAKTTAEKLDTWLGASGTVLPPGARERLGAKLAALEGGAL